MCYEASQLPLLILFIYLIAYKMVNIPVSRFSEPRRRLHIASFIRPPATDIQLKFSQFWSKTEKNIITFEKLEPECIWYFA